MANFHEFCLLLPALRTRHLAIQSRIETAEAGGGGGGMTFTVPAPFLWADNTGPEWRTNLPEGYEPYRNNGGTAESMVGSSQGPLTFTADDFIFSNGTFYIAASQSDAQALIDGTAPSNTAFSILNNSASHNIALNVFAPGQSVGVQVYNETSRDYTLIPLVKFATADITSPSPVYSTDDGSLSDLGGNNFPTSSFLTVTSSPSQTELMINMSGYRVYHVESGNPVFVGSPSNPLILSVDSDEYVFGASDADVNAFWNGPGVPSKPVYDFFLSSVASEDATLSVELTSGSTTNLLKSVPSSSIDVFSSDISGSIFPFLVRKS